MDVQEIKPRLIERLEELGLNYKDFSLAIGKGPGWLSDLLKGKQKTTKPDVDRAICKVLGVTEDWLRGKGPAPSLFAVAPEPTRRPSPANLSDFIAFRRSEIDAEIEALRIRLRALEDERRELIEAAKAVKQKAGR